jgi:hypothetical protein
MGVRRKKDESYHSLRGKQVIWEESKAFDENQYGASTTTLQRKESYHY